MKKQFRQDFRNICTSIWAFSKTAEDIIETVKETYELRGRCKP